MSKTKTNKQSKIYKGALIGAAGLMCLSFTPVTALNAFADYLGDSSNTIGSEAIYIVNAKDSVVRGAEYSIPEAYFGNEEIKLGLADAVYEEWFDSDGEDDKSFTYGTIQVKAITSKIDVFYSTGEKVAVAGGKFTADKVGDYTVKYSITVTYSDSATPKTYETELYVSSKTSTATMEFTENELVMPSIYDKKMAEKDGAYKDVELLIPKVYAESDSETPVAIADENIILNSKSGLGTSASLVITASAGKYTIIEENGKYYLKGSEINTKAANGDKITVKYAYYLDKSFITSVEKEIVVYNDYYLDDNDEANYKLTAVLDSTMSAITNVASTLPKVKAYSNEDANEQVAVITNAVAYKKDATGDYKETKDGSIADGKFTPWADGDYKIVFTVTDFYGNTATSELHVTGVKDSQKPVAYMYDAGDSANDRANGKFTSAETKLKTKTKQNNVIIYAIGATDNVTGVEDMTYSRTLKSSNRTIKVDGYSKYNLIFDYEFASLLSSNYVLKTQITNDFATSGKDVTKEEDVLVWLKEHNYLLITNTPKKTAEEVDYTEADYIAEGLAYVDVAYDGTFLYGSESGIAYTVSYTATDSAKNISETLAKTITVTSKSEYADSEKPTIEFTSTFKKAYSKDDVLTFTAPTISDDVDTSLEKSIYYIYKDAEGNQKGEKKYFEDDKYEINIAKDLEDTTLAGATQLEIVVEAVDDYGNKEIKTQKVKIREISDTEKPTLWRETYQTPSSGNLQNETIALPQIVYNDDQVDYIMSDVKVYKLENDGTKFEIDTYNKKTSTNLSSMTYTLDAGTFVAAYAGKYEAVVKIKDYAGNYVVTYYYYDVDAVNVVTGSSLNSTLAKSSTISVGEELYLPTPTISCEVGEGFKMFGIADDDSKTATQYKVVVKNSNNANAYDINEDTFKAYNLSSYTYKLAYQAEIAVYSDGFGFYNAEEGLKINISSKDYRVYKLSKDADYDGDYAFVKYNSGKIEEIIYGVVNGNDVTFYNLPFDGTEGGAHITFSETKYYAEIKDNTLVFMAKGGEEQFKFDSTTKKYVSNNGHEVDKSSSIVTPVVVKNSEEETFTANDLVFTMLESDVYSVKVSPIAGATLAGDYDYASVAEKGDTIEITPIQTISKADQFYGQQIDYEKSYVEISFSGRNSEGTSTSSSYSFYADRWTTYDEENRTLEIGQYDDETGKIAYKLSETNNGTYTITYYVYTKGVSEPQKTSFKIAVGDTAVPIIKVSNGFIKETYKVGDTLTFDMAKLTLSDNETTDVNVLMSKLSIKVTGPDGSEIENDEDGLQKNADDKWEFFSSYAIDEVGTYTITITVNDEVGNPATKTIEFEVTEETKDANVVSTAVGIVLIVVAVLILGGVVTYFVVSKVKLDKELKRKKK